MDVSSIFIEPLNIIKYYTVVAATTTVIVLFSLKTYYSLFFVGPRPLYTNLD